MTKRKKQKHFFVSKYKRMMWINYKKEVLTFLPMVLAIAWIALSSSRNTLSGMRSLAFPLFLGGWTGIIMMVKKESPSIIAPYYGKKAVITGALITGVSWFAAIVALLD